MASNEQFVLEITLRQKKAEVWPELDESKFFEFFTAEQILKDYDLTYEQIESGIVGGGNDGGVDGVYGFVNSDLITEDTDTAEYKRGVRIDLFLIQAKTSRGFSESAIDRFDSLTHDVLDLGKDLGALVTVYRPEVLRVLEWFRRVYRDLASKFPILTITYVYATQADQLHSNVSRKVSSLESRVKALFSDCEFKFLFLGARELLALAREMPKVVYELNLVENPISAGNVGYVCLVRLSDYYRFICSQGGRMNISIFESNVRDYQGNTDVNEGIAASLGTASSEDFWWLNNGVTVLATKGSIVGKTLNLENPQIVNGLQTSTEIYKYLSSHSIESDDRNILVRVIVPSEATSRERIIRATNSQTSIPLASLRATDEIHRNIEDHFVTLGLYYDRRKNQHKNAGRPKDKIISIPYLAQAIMAIVLRRPDDSRARPSSLLKADENYNLIFNPEYPVTLYLLCTRVVRHVADYLRRSHLGLTSNDRNNVQFHVAMYAVHKVLGRTAVRPTDIAALSLSDLTDEVLEVTLGRVTHVFNRIESRDRLSYDQIAKGPGAVRELLSDLESVLASPGDGQKNGLE